MKSKLPHSIAVGVFTCTLATSLIAAPSSAASRPAALSTPNQGNAEMVQSISTAQNSPIGLVALVQEISNVPANDVVYDSARSFLYASVGASGGASANSILAINVPAGTVAASIPVGSLPNKLAISADNQFLYVGLDDVGTVRRIDLNTRLTNIEFPIGLSAECGRNRAGDLKVPPGLPNSVAVVATAFCAPGQSSPRYQGVWMFDDGERRVVSTLPEAVPNDVSLQFGTTADTLYEYSLGRVRKLNITAAGVYLAIDLSTLANTGDEFPTRHLAYDGQSLYMTNGVVVNADGGSRTGKYALQKDDFAQVRSGEIVIVNTAAKKVMIVRGGIYASGAEKSAPSVQVMSIGDFANRQDLPVLTAFTNPSRVAEISPGVYAFRTNESKLYFLRIFSPITPIANAGPDANIGVLAQVTLNGSVTLDPNAQVQSYQWRQLSGPTVTLNGANTLTPNFVPVQTGVYEFEFVVRDSFGQQSAPDTVMILVSPPSKIFLTTALNNWAVPSCESAVFSDFNGPDVHWPIGRVGNVGYDLNNGVYQLNALQSDIAFSFAPASWGIPLSTTISAEAWSNPDRATAAVGLAFGIKSSIVNGKPQPDSWYAFLINPPGQEYRLERWFPNAPSGVLIASGQHPNIAQSPTSPQKLEVRYGGGRAVMLVNGFVVASQPIENFETRTLVGVMAVNNRSNSIAYFDNFRVTANTGCISDVLVGTDGQIYP